MKMPASRFGALKVDEYSRYAWLFQKTTKHNRNMRVFAWDYGGQYFRWKQLLAYPHLPPFKVNESLHTSPFNRLPAPATLGWQAWLKSHYTRGKRFRLVGKWRARGQRDNYHRWPKLLQFQLLVFCKSAAGSVVADALLTLLNTPIRLRFSNCFFVASMPFITGSWISIRTKWNSLASISQSPLCRSWPLMTGSCACAGMSLKSFG